MSINAACQCLRRCCGTHIKCGLPATHCGVCGLGVDGPKLGKLLVWESCADVGDGCNGGGRRRATVLNTGT